MNIDVIIVGGGPAGVSAAYDLAVEGLQVLILDKSAFPRDKACGGGVTGRAMNLLRYDISPVVRDYCRDVSFSYHGKKHLHLLADDPQCAMTVRAELDYFCLQQVLGLGVDFKQIDGLSRLVEHEDHVQLIDTAGNNFRCRFVIGADGAHSKVRSMIEGVQKQQIAFAFEGIAPSPDSVKGGSFNFDFGCVKNGYGWLFPKQDHVNIGLYTSTPYSQKLNKKQLNDYAKSRYGIEALEKICGYPIPTGAMKYHPANARVILAGDAAGCAENFFGEGIHNAIQSGQLAAQSIVEALTQDQSLPTIYHNNLAPIRRNLRVMQTASQVFYATLPLSFAILRATGAPLHTLVNKRRSARQQASIQIYPQDSNK